MMAYTGGCQCGKYRYEMDVLKWGHVCHCRMCQRATGGLFAALFRQLVVDIFGFVIIGHLGQAVKPVAGEPPPSPPPAECR